MATTETTVTSYKTACAEVADAIIAADFKTARTKIGVAEAINAALEVEAEGGEEKVRRRETLDGLARRIAEIEAANSRAGDNRRLITTQTRHTR